MFTIKLDNTQVYHNLNLLTGFPTTSSLIVTNNSGSQAKLILSDGPPTGTNVGFPCVPGQTVLIHGNDNLAAWCKGGTDGYLIIQELTSTVTPFTGVEFPQDIVTSGVEGFRRLQVDIGQTGFFEGREFRTTRKIRLATAETQIYKFNCAIDYILWSLNFDSSVGQYEVNLWDESNVTENTAFTTPVPFLRKNRSTEFRSYSGSPFVSQTTLTTGGTITVADIEDYSDYVDIKADSRTTFSTTVGAGLGSERYFPPGITYIEIKVKGAASVEGTIAMSWEERPQGVK
jgi:hypothetical protein